MSCCKNIWITTIIDKKAKKENIQQSTTKPTKRSYLSQNDGHKECTKKVVRHLKDLSEHAVWNWQLSDHQQGLLCIEEAPEVTAAAAKMDTQKMLHFYGDLFRGRDTEMTIYNNI